jgi:hypothetical protein
MAKDMSDSLEPDKFRWPFSMISQNGDSPPGTHAAGSAHDDEFDLDSLRLPQDFSASTGVKKILTTVPIRRPDRQEFIRVHPDPSTTVVHAHNPLKLQWVGILPVQHNPLNFWGTRTSIKLKYHCSTSWWLQTLVLEVKADRETYLIHPSLRDELLARHEVVPKVLFTTVTRQGVLHLWPIRLPGEDGRLDSWNQSALEATQPAKTHWVRVVPNHDLRGYEVYQATNLSDDPIWPAISFEEFVKIACKQRFIDSWDHPVLRQLRGDI